MERYLIALNAYKRVPLELEQILRENVHPMTVRKHDIVQSTSVINDCLYFVEKGLFHIFLDKQGKQVTVRFKREDEFIISLKELDSHKKESVRGIEALEDGVLWLFPGPLVSQLREKYTQFVFQFGTILLNDIASMEEARDCSYPDAGSTNYDRLRKYSPELLNRVPIPYLANYTNIPENIFRHLHSSKIKLKVSITRRRKR